MAGVAVAENRATASSSEALSAALFMRARLQMHRIHVELARDRFNRAVLFEIVLIRRARARIGNNRTVE
jgi:hypothetical protein